MYNLIVTTALHQKLRFNHYDEKSLKDLADQYGDCESWEISNDNEVIMEHINLQSLPENKIN